MPKHRKTPEGARADQRWETDGGTPAAETSPVDPATARRDQRWQSANDQHWHNRGYSDATRGRATLAKPAPPPRPPEED